MNKDTELNLKECLGRLYQSNGKYEPEHWFHLVISATDSGVETITNNNNLHWLSDKELEDGYKEVTISEAGETIESYLWDCFNSNKHDYDIEEDSVFMKNIVEVLKKDML